MSASATVQDGPAQHRLVAIDWLRGLVMILMTIDHASEALNKGRFFQDASFMWKPGTPLPVDQFALRWVTHLCAPTFVFLAGVSLALSSAKRLQAGESERSIGSVQFKRGLFIALLDPLWMSLGMMLWTGILLQVLYAIGVSMMLMVPLRRLPDRTLAISALVFMLLSEALTGLSVMASGGEPTVPSALLLSAGFFEMAVGPLKRFIVAYPVLHWLAIMALGHASARWLERSSREGTASRTLVRVGLAALALFVLVRGLNSYGNMRLLRDDMSLVHWLHVSKYPPSVTYIALELGLMALLLAGFIRLERARVARALAPVLGPLALLGQTALFYYVLHIHLITLVTHALGYEKAFEIGGTLIGAALTLFVLYFACVPYRRYKSAHPNGWARYL